VGFAGAVLWESSFISANKLIRVAVLYPVLLQRILPTEKLSEIDVAIVFDEPVDGFLSILG
ncbi:MAG: hypothetical protein Q8R42_09155, partial [Desulfocapsaceae bacterium]|nr:hypothetical protein [Desulfocapsaceae bacterium]